MKCVTVLGFRVVTKLTLPLFSEVMYKIWLTITFSLLTCLRASFRASCSLRIPPPHLYQQRLN